MSQKSILHKFPETGLGTLEMPASLNSKLKSIKDSIIQFFSSINLAEGVSSLSSKASRYSFKPPQISRKRLLRYGMWAGIIGALLFGGYRLITLMTEPSESPGKVQVQGATAVLDINREFSFPLKDSNGEDVSQLKYTIERAELRDEIIVKGQRASSVKGRTFLIINLKIANEYNKSIQVNSRDYIRLSVNGNEAEWLAPDVHNDPVEVQAISTKYTRVGFPINTTDKNLILRVGEIEGDKEKIEISFN